MSMCDIQCSRCRIKAYSNHLHSSIFDFNFALCAHSRMAMLHNGPWRSPHTISSNSCFVRRYSCTAAILSFRVSIGMLSNILHLIRITSRMLDIRDSSGIAFSWLIQKSWAKSCACSRSKLCCWQMSHGKLPFRLFVVRRQIIWFICDYWALYFSLARLGSIVTVEQHSKHARRTHSVRIIANVFRITPCIQATFVWQRATITLKLRCILLNFRDPEPVGRAILNYPSKMHHFERWWSFVKQQDINHPVP